jgi:hypothetical protein
MVLQAGRLLVSSCSFSSNICRSVTHLSISGFATFDGFYSADLTPSTTTRCKISDSLPCAGTDGYWYKWCILLLEGHGKWYHDANTMGRGHCPSPIQPYSASKYKRGMPMTTLAGCSSIPSGGYSNAYSMDVLILVTPYLELMTWPTLCGVAKL